VAGDLQIDSAATDDRAEALNLHLGLHNSSK
jgi:hypothetical protein